jgi:hypothetical protein
MRLIAVFAALSLFCFVNAPVLAADATLTNEQVRQAVGVAFTGNPGIQVTGVLELPQFNAAKADIYLTNLLIRIPEKSRRRWDRTLT